MVASGPLSPVPLHGNEVRIAPSVGRRLGIEGGAVEVVSAGGAVPVLARVRSVASHEADESLLEIGGLLWTQLRTRPGDAVGLRCPVDLPTCRSLVVRSDDTEVDPDEFFRDLVEHERPVVRGMTVALTGRPGHGRSATIDQVEPSPSVPTASTTVSGYVRDSTDGTRSPTLSELGGVGEVLDRLRLLVEWPLMRPEIFARLGVRPSKGVLLHGPPGAGKTYTSRALARDLGAQVIAISSTELIGEYPGETEKNIRALFRQAAREAPTLVLIDEIDVVAGTRDSLVSQADVRCATELLEVLDGLHPHDGVVVLGTTNRLASIDPAFRRPGRFDAEVYIGPPDVSGRAEILSIHAREMPFAADARAAFGQLAEATHGFVAADLMSLVRETGLAAVRRLYRSNLDRPDPEALDESLQIEVTDIREAFAATSPSILRSIEAPPPGARWESLVGLEDVKDRLLSWGLAAAAGDVGSIRSGVLLEGPSGNGKSVLARSLAERLGVNCVVIEPGEVYSEWLGESERTVRNRFDRALAARPSLVILEHLDILAPSRASSHRDRASDRVVATVVTCIDAAVAKGGVLVIGITDRATEVDEAVTRAGRLGTRISLPNPGESQRLALLDGLAPDHLVSETAVRDFLETTDGMSVAELLQELRQGRG